MDLDALRTFAKVAELGSFTQAAHHIGIGKTRISTRVQQLETELGTRLLHRTTRSVRLTPDGEQFAARCRVLLDDVDELQTLFQPSPGALRGRLRVDLPLALARELVIPRLPGFLQIHPLVEIELSTTDRFVDVVHEGFDCVLRVGALADSGLVARRLGWLRMINVASPAYLQKHGVPRKLADLASHRLVQYASVFGMPATGWEYREGDRVRHLAMAGPVTVNSSDAYNAAALAGLGIIQAPAIGLVDTLAQGRLVEVLPKLRASPMPISLVYPNRRNVALQVQAFMAWLGEILRPYIETEKRTGQGVGA